MQGGARLWGGGVSPTPFAKITRLVSVEVTYISEPATVMDNTSILQIHHNQYTDKRKMFQVMALIVAQLESCRKLAMIV